MVWGRHDDPRPSSGDDVCGTFTARGPSRSSRPRNCPSTLEAGELAAIIMAADYPRTRLLMHEQWRAGLRVIEVLNLVVSDLPLEV